MTDQNGDQAALDGLVDDCYPDGWPWKVGDRCLSADNGVFPVIGTGIDVDHEGNVHTLILPTVDGIQHHSSDGYRPHAGTWVEGRLRELIGDRFRGLRKVSTITPKWRFEVAFLHPENYPPEEYVSHKSGPTPITALVAALRVLKQKEEVKSGLG